MTTTDTKPVLLVDLSSIGHPIWHMSQSEPDPDYTSQRIVAKVLKLAADHPHTAICCDAPGPSFRKAIDPTYKANRPKQQAPLYHQIRLAKEALAEEGFPVWEVAGFEGDDLIATATKELLYGSTIITRFPVLIASADKDLLALVSDTVSVHSTRNGDILGPAEVREKLGVDPRQVVDYLTLVGDVADNITGAKGIGGKTAAGLLGIFGNLDDVYGSIDEGTAGLKPRSSPALRNSARVLSPSGSWSRCAPTCRWTWQRCSTSASRRRQIGLWRMRLRNSQKENRWTYRAQKMCVGFSRM